MFFESKTTTSSRFQEIVYRVFGWMACGLTITGAVSYYIATSPTYSLMLFTKPWLLFALLLMQLLISFIFIRRLAYMSWGAALLCFITYSFLTGLTLSSLFHIYSTITIFKAFFITAGMFASMAIYGAVTKADLSSLTSILFMGLWGIIIASLVNIFMRSESFSLFISWICVVLFCLLTTFDMSMIKRYAQVPGPDRAKLALLASFNLYLDFINLFLAILRITGRRKE